MLWYLDQGSVGRFEQALIRVLIQVRGFGVDGADPVDGEIRPNLNGGIFLLHRLGARIEVGLSLRTSRYICEIMFFS